MRLSRSAIVRQGAEPRVASDDARRIDRTAIIDNGLLNDVWRAGRDDGIICSAAIAASLLGKRSLAARSRNGASFDGCEARAESCGSKLAANVPRRPS